MRESLREAPPLSGLLISKSGFSLSMGNNNLNRCKECLSVLTVDEVARFTQDAFVWCYMCENYVSEVV